jgi:hypothetical protein
MSHQIDKSVFRGYCRRTSSGSRPRAFPPSARLAPSLWVTPTLSNPQQTKRTHLLLTALRRRSARSVTGINGAWRTVRYCSSSTPT